MSPISVLIAMGAILSQKVAFAAPVSSPVGVLEYTSSDAYAAGELIRISGVNKTIFGQESMRYDYFMTGSSLAATESVGKLAFAIDSGTEHEIVVAFLNSTMAGTMTPDQASDDAWKCQELSDHMVYEVSLCPNPPAGDVPRDDSSLVEKRSRFAWLRSARHVASNAAVNILYGALGNALYANFPSSPRSWCNSANGQNACISWSNVEKFNHDYARFLVSDALSSIDFNRYSAQANNILGSRKRHAADVCISNRADGCT